MLQYYHYVELILEIGAISVMINYLLKFFWGSRALDVSVALILFLCIFGVSAYFDLAVLEKIMSNIANIALLAILVIFQPELRIACSKIRIRRVHRDIDDLDTFIDHLATSVYRLAEKQTGALIVLENQDSYEEYEHSAVEMRATFSSELLESIFVTSSPLHDGAVVLKGTTIVAAGVILPLAQETLGGFSKTLGTRHRAALGASQKTDALIIVVSEESGKVSIAREGVMSRGIKIDRFRGVVRSLYASPNKEKKLHWKFWK